MDLVQIIDIALTVIGGVVVILGAISPFTKNTWDDKILQFLKSFTNAVKVNKTNTSKLVFKKR